ncbi:MAG: WYL domain-containing protein [Spirochaetae bacterium HGW-Spirochaetae-8]|jgi:predicted DNA-binding transcriptional regulator YafY|nr:MAG: WYL domain-containing protein [Spirochaetae bacterium HGW-Spirochaetae-8]
MTCSVLRYGNADNTFPTNQPFVYNHGMSQTERIFYIDRMIRNTGSVRCDKVAKQYEVCERQVKRDIMYMRDRLRAPITWDHVLRAYHYDTDYPVLQFSDEKALVFSALLRSLVKASDIIPLVSEQAMELVDQSISSEYRALSDRIVYSVPVLDRTDYQVFAVVCEAMGSRQCISIEYRNAKGESSARTIEPLKLINYSGRWYVVAFDLLRGELRSFHLARIAGLQLLTCKVLERGLDEALEKYINSGFGIFMGVETKEALVRITGNAVFTVEHQIWHKDQKIEHAVDESGSSILLLRIPVANWAELLGRILSFGALAEPLEPQELREQWQAKIKELYRLVHK